MRNCNVATQESGYHYPTPREAGVRIPPHVNAGLFCAGFEHGLKGGQLVRTEYMRLSFREGFRASRLYLREVRRIRGVLEFPTRWRVRMNAV